MTVHTSTIMLPVRFAIFTLLKFGKDKGKVDPRSYHTVTLWRNPSMGETVGDTIERMKLMYSEWHYDSKTRKPVVTERMTQRWRILTAEETEAERIARYERDGLEVVLSVDSGATVSPKVEAIKVTDGVNTFDAVRATDKDWEDEHDALVLMPIASGDPEVEASLAQMAL